MMYMIFIDFEWFLWFLMVLTSKCGFDLIPQSCTDFARTLVARMINIWWKRWSTTSLLTQTRPLHELCTNFARTFVDRGQIIYFHLNSYDFSDFQWFSLNFRDFNDFQWFSIIFIDFWWICGFQWVLMFLLCVLCFCIFSFMTLQPLLDFLVVPNTSHVIS